MIEGNKAEPSIGSTWQDVSGRKWVQLQARTDAQLGPLGLPALRALELEPGESVLDIGCGAGQTLLQLAHQVGNNGRVVGLDISEPLLTRAKEMITGQIGAPVEVVLGNAATYSFAPTFDALFSRFGVMFFDDPMAAFGNLRSALKPRGRLSFVCWQAHELNPWASVPLAAVLSVDPTRELPEMLMRLQPGPYQLAEPGFVLDVLTNAGFLDIQILTHEAQVALGGAQTIAEAVDYALKIGPAARFVAAADTALLPEFRAALAHALAPYLTPDGVLMTARTLVCTARRS